MFRVFSAFFFALVLVTQASAQISDPYPLTPQEAFRAAIQAGDVERVEDELRKGQVMVQTGLATGEDMRWLFTDFTTTNPEVIGFVADWLAAYPDSPFAHTAQAWVYTGAGWHIRGDKPARETYPEAMRQQAVLHDKAWDHAERAYELAPRLIPASDALIRLGRTVGAQDQSYRVLAEVMQSDPNYGSIVRAMEPTAPGYGGTWTHASWLCETYGDLVPEGQLYCLVDAGGSIHARDHGEWARETIVAEGFESLDYLRIFAATSGWATRADAEFAYRSLTDGRTDWKRARRFDENIAGKYGYPMIGVEHLQRAQDLARAALAHDPYDPGLLTVLQQDIMPRKRRKTATCAASGSAGPPMKRRRTMRGASCSVSRSMPSIGPTTGASRSSEASRRIS